MSPHKLLINEHQSNSEVSIDALYKTPFRLHNTFLQFLLNILLLQHVPLIYKK